MTIANFRLAELRWNIRAEADFERKMLRLAEELGSASRALNEDRIFSRDQAVNLAWFEDASRRIGLAMSERLAALTTGGAQS